MTAVTASGLIVIGDLPKEERPFKCFSCGARLTEREYMREGTDSHIAQCSRRHEEQERAQSWRQKNPYLFDPNESGDVELGKWIRNNREAILLGRKKI